MIASGFFDLVDGAVARHNGTASTFGAFLDSTLDRLVDMAVLAGMIMFYAGHGAPGIALVAGVALVSSVLVSYAKARAEVVMGRLDAGFFERGERMGILALGAVTGYPAGRARRRRRRRDGHRAAAHRDRAPRDGEDRRGGARLGGPHAVSSEQRGERGFIVVDKRGAKRAPEAAAAPRPQPRRRASCRSRTSRRSRSPSATRRSIHLGLVARSADRARRATRDVALARQTIDTLEMLEEKTRGNLTADEARLLEDLLYDLRMRFVEASK